MTSMLGTGDLQCLSRSMCGVLKTEVDSSNSGRENGTSLVESENDGGKTCEKTSGSDPAML